MVVINSLIAVLIAGFGTVISLQQYRLNKKMATLSSQKVKWDLFEKRYKIYHLTKEILFEISQNNKIDLSKLRDFNFSIRERVFLFEDDINEYIKTIRENGIEINHTSEKLSGLIEFPAGTKEWKEISDRNWELIRWFSAEYQENVENRFMKYLNFQGLI